MMELWEACFFVLILGFTFGKDVPSNATSVLRQIDSCPDVGYFFKREPSPNLVQPGACFLCFCKDNSTAACWQRESRRCDVERYHHHRVGRFRRSFSDVFFRDAARDFFGKNLPEHCKPYESSFSDGCPPADWCVGCTICDCDANGRWDCHVLSFCDGKESKKKVKVPKKRRVKKNKKSLDYESVDVRPLKKSPSRNTTKKTPTKPKTTKPPKKNVKKAIKAKPVNKKNTHTYKFSKNNNKQSTIKKRVPQNIAKKTQSKSISKNHPKNYVSKAKIITKIKTTRRPVKINRNTVKELRVNANNNDTIKLGQKIVKQVMTTVKKILAKEIDKLNETKRTMLMEAKSCGGVKKRDKRTYNVRSKAVARKKNKNNRQGMIKENYTNARIKREILDQRLASVEKISVITLPTDINAVIPLETTKDENSFSTFTLDNVTSVPSFTPLQDNYYEYSIKNDSHWTSTTEITKHVTANRNNDSENNLKVIVDSNNNTPNITRNNDTTDTNPAFNDLKFSKWYIIKIKNAEQKKQVTRLLLPKPSTVTSFEYGNNTDKRYYGSQLQKKNLESKNYTITKHTSTTHVLRNYRKPCCTKSPVKTNKADLSGLNNILQTLYSELNKTTAKRKVKSKVSVLRYVRKFFRKIFSKKNTGNHKVYGLGSNEDHTLQILCENIGPCKIKKNNKLILKYKLQQLNKETRTVLKSIRTVKGLLHLLELPDSDKTYTVKNSSFENDIQKLGTVLKNYKDDEMNSSLTFTQKIQIDFIKKNTQTFLESVKKFADILTDILAIMKPNIEHDQRLKSSLKQQSNTTSLNKIKKILYQYNMMQNTFMRKMYDLIKGEEKKTTTTERTQIFGSDGNQNSTDKALENYSQKIIENLRKLKSLAQVLSSKTKRQKRELMMRDDALEYLLTLMEMLIRQNHPVTTVPANDGIDLLIDAIKNAPDIKPLKKYLDAPITSISKQKSNAEINDQMMSESNSDSKRISNEENVTDTEENIINQDYAISQDNVARKENVVIQDNSKSNPLTIKAIDADVTQKVYYRVFNEQSNNEDDVTTEYNSITKKRSNDEIEKIGFDKFESYLGDPNVKSKLDVESAYGEEDAIGDITTDPPVTMGRTSDNTDNNTDATDRNVEDHIVYKSRNPQRTTAYIAPINDSSSESQDSMNEKRSKLEWIEETFDREIRMINNTSTHAPKLTSTLPTPTATKKKTLKSENISDISKDDQTEDSVIGSGKKTKVHDVLYEKQLQFLNSLDYGTEKSADFEESYSKDDTRSDDVFPAYFVE